MRTGAFDVDLYLQSPLFTDAKDVGEPAAAGVYGVAPAFVDGEGSGQLVCVVVGQPAKAVTSAVFFIRAGGQHQRILKLYTVALQQMKGKELSGKQTLAVGRAPSEDAAVRYGGAERIEAPLGLFLHGNYVRVRHEEETGFAGAPLHSGDEVPPVGGGLQDIGCNAVFGQPALGKLADRRLVSGGHEAGIDRRDAHQVPFQFDYLVAVGLYLGQQIIDCRHGCLLATARKAYRTVRTYGQGGSRRASFHQQPRLHSPVYPVWIQALELPRP